MLSFSVKIGKSAFMCCFRNTDAMQREHRYANRAKEYARAICANDGLELCARFIDVILVQALFGQ